MALSAITVFSQHFIVSAIPIVRSGADLAAMDWEDGESYKAGREPL